MTTELMAGRWGTWEELLLGGAVLRYGTRDWNLVAAEVRARTVTAFTFTPEICRAKFEDLQQRYLGCKAWFEELRKQRMAELRQALEQSEGSIGSLELKLESLKAEKRDDHAMDYDSSQTELQLLSLKSEGIESSSKDTSKDGLSAGSFTQDAQTKWSAECQVLAAVPAEGIDVRPEISVTFDREKLSIEKLKETVCGGQFLNIRKRRGKRKRKDCSRDVKEGSVGESEFLGSADIATASWCKETSVSNSAQIARSSGVDDQTRCPNKELIGDLMRVFSSVEENECASVFRRRLDSQKRGRYKKMILQHIDFDTIRSRIARGSFTSLKELYRDMLLVANNALLFYSKNTREYKSALLLRYIVTAVLRQHLKDSGNKPTTSILPSSSSMHKPPAMPRSIRPGNRKLPGKVANPRNAAGGTSNGSKKPFNVDSPPSMDSLAVTKKGLSQPRKVGHGRALKKSETSERKRTRAW
ncbi:hypothetical protein SLEP1_g52912 [Rubroshorea leprosula]|uniref:Bromo domain-containing protein n=1 Tax=Rubroshorea leprosula TaxID=152421 RepID=A0AAV5M8Q2_9ROSI|nr:hypothetical protein SLEP1_g52912 [Rubroshorea leprosula]